MARARKISEWITWRSRERLKELELPGVYIIGKYPTAPSTLDVESPSILYIGHTVRPLRYRLRQFHHSAFNAKDGHYGGKTFSEIFFSGRPGPVPRGLRVCVISVYGREPARSALIRLIERKYIYHFVRHHGRLPQCNKA